MNGEINKKNTLIIRSILFYLFLTGSLSGVLYFYIISSNTAILIFGSIFTFGISALLQPNYLRYEQLYYRFKPSKNNVFRNPDASLVDGVISLSKPIIYKDKFNSKFNLYANILMVLFGFFIFLVLTKYVELIGGGVIYIVPLAFIIFGIRNLFRNSKTKMGNIVLKMGIEGIWTEKMNVIPWQSIREINMYLENVGGFFNRTSRELIFLEIIRFDYTKDRISLWELDINKYRFRKQIINFRKNIRL